MGDCQIILFRDTQYRLQVIKFNKLQLESLELQILFQGVTMTMVEDPSGWKLKNDAENLCSELIAEIGSVIKAKYRMY